MKTYQDRIRELREDHDYTQKQIANVLKVHYIQYSKYERGINEMPIKHIVELCKFYKVSADYILGLKK